MRVFLHILYCIILLFVTGSAQVRLNAPNFRIHPGTMVQTEPVATVSPTNPQVLFASSYTINTSTSFKSEGVYVSTDGGVTWQGSDTCTGELFINHGGDPGVMIAPDGKLILSHIGSVFHGMYTHYSTNLGATWSQASIISTEQPEDKGAALMDSYPTSPYYGRAYLAWVVVQDPAPVFFSYSTNSGVSWDTARIINPGPPARCSGGWITTGYDGRVYVCWAGMTSSPFTEDFVGLAISGDGGATWSVNQNIFDMNGINGRLSTKSNIKVNGLPQIEIDRSGALYNDYLYIVTTEKNLAPAGSDPDVILRRSTDRGQTWSSGIRVNQDALNNGKIQYFPSIAIDDFGGINIIYYDDRATTADSAEIVLARSIDAGATWNEYIISDHRCKPKQIPGGAAGFQGDHISLVANGDILQAFWMDDFSGTYQIWSARIEYKTLSADDFYTNPAGYALNPNYPNPFNPVTNISYTLPRSGVVTVAIYDILGNAVAVLVNETKQAGKHSVQWNAANLPSGIYLCRLVSGNYAETRKMALIR